MLVKGLELFEGLFEAFYYIFIKTVAFFSVMLAESMISRFIKKQE